MTDTAQANGYECLSCGETERTDSATEDCGECGSSNTVPAVITDCDLGLECVDDFHFHGADWHVRTGDGVLVA